MLSWANWAPTPQTTPKPAATSVAVTSRWNRLVGAFMVGTLRASWRAARREPAGQGVTGGLTPRRSPDLPRPSRVIARAGHRADVDDQHGVQRQRRREADLP